MFSSPGAQVVAWRFRHFYGRFREHGRENVKRFNFSFRGVISRIYEHLHITVFA